MEKRHKKKEPSRFLKIRKQSIRTGEDLLRIMRKQTREACKHQNHKVIWVCNGRKRKGKDFCDGTRVPDTIIKGWGEIKKIFIFRERMIRMARSVTVIPARSQKVRTGHKAVQEKKIRVAAYCRVSTDQEDQLHSFEAQVEYYTKYINEHENYEMAGIYADEGISGTNTKKREQFKR